MFLRNGDETKKLNLFLAEPPFAPKIRNLFEKKFGVSPSSNFFSFFSFCFLLSQRKSLTPTLPPERKIYICDSGNSVFYELEDFHSIHEGSILKLHSGREGGMFDSSSLIVLIILVVNAIINNKIAGQDSGASGSALADDVHAIKQVILSEKFQKILSTPEHLEAESQVRRLLLFFLLCFSFFLTSSCCCLPLAACHRNLWPKRLLRLIRSAPSFRKTFGRQRKFKRGWLESSASSLER